MLAALGADVCIDLTADDKTLQAQFSEQAAQQIDVVVDYLWGHSAELMLPALAKHSPATRRCAMCRWVPFPAPISRSMARCCAAPLQLMGSGIGSLSMPQLLAATGEMLQAPLPVVLPSPPPRGRSAKSRAHGRGRQPETDRFLLDKKTLPHKRWG
jgi:hypothetical protein